METRTKKIVTPAEAAAELLQRRKIKESLYEFVKQGFATVEGGRPFVDNWHIGAKCEHLEAVWRGEIKNLLINEPPRELKSTVVNVLFFCWAWANDPGTRWLFTSYAFNLAMRDSRRCRAMITSPWYRARFGDTFTLLDDSNRVDRFDNNKSGYRLTTSIDSATMGDGGDIIIADDPNNTRDRSDVMLQSTLDWWQNVMPTRVNDWFTVRRIVIQQRTHERDLSGHILDGNDGSWIHLKLPMEFEPHSRCVTVALPSTKPEKWQDPRTEEGEILNKNRIGPKELRQLKKDLGSAYNVAGQLQQRPSPEAGGIIQKAWFKHWKLSDPPDIKYTILSVDTALSEKKSAAYSAATTWGVFEDREVPQVILLSVWRERCEYPVLRERIQRLANDYLDDGPGKPKGASGRRKPDIILIEAKANGLSLIQDLARAGVMATRFNPDKIGDKIQRVRMITPLLEAGRVWMPAQPPRFMGLRPFADLFVEQAAAFPNAASRDLIDTASQALWRLQSTGFVWHPGDPRMPEYTRLGAGPQAYY